MLTVVTSLKNPFLRNKSMNLGSSLNVMPMKNSFKTHKTPVAYMCTIVRRRKNDDTQVFDGGDDK